MLKITKFPEISVIIPNLNDAAALPYFLESLRAQGAPCFELVVVDGNSEDDSREIISSYGDLFPIVQLLDPTRNLGYVRNMGARFARASLLLFTNSDAVLSRDLLFEIYLSFQDRHLQALSGRTIPFNGGALSFAAYSCFDLLRSFMANHLGRFSPSGNFLAIRAPLFWGVGGFPEASVNEDGLLGKKISIVCQAFGQKARFKLDLKTGHFAKRFRKGPLKTLLFYSYVFGNFSPLLARLLAGVEKRSGEGFKQKCLA